MQSHTIEQDVIATYRDRAQHYDWTANLYYFAGFREIAYRKPAIAALNLHPGATVLEIGCVAMGQHLGALDVTKSYMGMVWMGRGVAPPIPSNYRQSC